VQICRCLWLLYGDVGKHINMENVHSETNVWHISTIFGFCMIVVSPICKWPSRWWIFWSHCLLWEHHTHCFHIFIHVIVLWMYTNAINTQLKYIEKCNSTCFNVHRWTEEDLQSSVNIVYVSITYPNYIIMLGVWECCKCRCLYPLSFVLCGSIWNSVKFFVFWFQRVLQSENEK
jgi:hypothetical protein